ncbi:F-box only protein 9-like isoform X2 [Portunus trituberculatus]|uniref:F-box only protein 9-like isoform X2 n=1 Tax=Portunus trituberculatus TaxID=210409 RepID=UPI001E1D0FC7|nr:F-box only protein 9-like isoform X2 [Portunus trituberculatus]
MADTTNSAGADDDIALGDLTEQESNARNRQDPESVLASFREEWQRELEGAQVQKGLCNVSMQSSPSKEATQGSSSHNKGGLKAVQSALKDNGSDSGGGIINEGGEGSSEGYGVPNVESSTPMEEVTSDVEAKATELFKKAVELEQSGRLYEAIQFYRRAMTLVPDIEFRVHHQNMLEWSENYQTQGEGEDTTSEDELDQEEIQDLVFRFQALASSSQAVCIPQFDQEAPHISCLPPEMLERIMHWVVGSDLDMRSLEQVSRVCQGFYLVARNPELWHKACLRIWGLSCGVPGAYGSWRNMFIQRPHPRYNGCYISRTTYFRSGESSFQDQNYQPWHLVQYYRYLRFFPDGIVSMLTTADEPHAVVSQLRTRDVRNPQVLQGHYCILGSSLSLVLKRRSRERQMNRRKGRRYRGGTTDVAETIFQIEYEIRPVKEHLHWQLVWRTYTIISIYFDDKQNISQIDVSDASKFPPLLFSRVKSYSMTCDSPLT